MEAGVVGKPSTFTTLQSVVALVAGLSSIVGAAYSAVGAFHSTPATGEIAVVVRDAATAEAVRGAAVEVLTAEGALVTTLPERDDGRAHGAVAPGSYRVRVGHPEFAEAVRDVQVLPDGTAEVRVALGHRVRRAPVTASERSAPARGGDPVAEGAARAVERGVGAGRRLLGRLGF